MAPTELVDDRYEVGPRIGHGAMGDVHEATDIRLHRPVAIKFLRADLAHQEDARRRFEEEAKAAAALNHPHVVAVFDFGEADGIPYIVMERLPGRTLADEIREGPLTESRACHVAVSVLRALHAAHNAGVLHRDIKPGNVLLTTSNDAKVADFGIAKAGENSDSTLTGAILGTPAYLAPERLSGHPATPASDVYAVGILLWEALAGRRPYVGDNTFAITTAVMTQDPPPLGRIRPDLHPTILATIDRAMAKDPTVRFQTAGQMGRALTGEARPADAAPATVAVTRSAPPVPAVRRSSARPGLALAVLLLLAGCVAVIVMLATRSSPSSSAQTTPPVSTPATQPGATIAGPLSSAIDQLQQAVQH